MNSKAEQAVLEVLERAETSSSARPSIDALRSRTASRRRRRRVLASVLTVCLIVGISLGVSAISSEGTSELVSREPMSGVEMLASINDLLDVRDRDPLVASARFYATTETGEPLFSEVERYPLFAVDFRRWKQIDGSDAIEMRIANRSVGGSTGCGTIAQGSLHTSANAIQLEFMDGVFPQVEDVDFLGGDSFECEAFTPVALLRIFETSFSVEIEGDSGFTLISDATEGTSFAKWDDDEPPVPPSA